MFYRFTLIVDEHLLDNLTVTFFNIILFIDFYSLIGKLYYWQSYKEHFTSVIILNN